MLSKCNKFSLGKKSAVGDRPAIKRNEKAISWDRLPFATAPLLTSEDVEVQKIRVCLLILWNVSHQLTDIPTVPRHLERGRPDCGT